jgi:hypothetical protein
MPARQLAEDEVEDQADQKHGDLLRTRKSPRPGWRGRNFEHHLWPLVYHMFSYFSRPRRA